MKNNGNGNGTTAPIARVVSATKHLAQALATGSNYEIGAAKRRFAKATKSAVYISKIDEILQKRGQS